jgi:tRNA A37 threonylcarbamoyladenosine modification protein TsaB
MWLFIDTSAFGIIRLGLISGERQNVKTYTGRSSGLLTLVQKRVGMARLQQVQGICVVAGPGSFSAVRGGVLAANLLARLLKKKLIGVYLEQTQNLKQLMAQIAQGQLAPTDFVAPVYISEPNITQPRIE